MIIKKSIRQNLNILQEQKKRNLIEEKIIKGRLSNIPRNVNRYSKIQVNKSFNILFTEIRKLKLQGLNQEIINENLMGVFNTMFSENDPNFIRKVKEKLSEYLENKLQITEFEKEILKNTITNLEDEDIIEVFNDPRFLSRKIAENYSEDIKNKYSIFDEKQIKSLLLNLEDKFIQKLSPIIGNVNSNMELTLKGIRDNFLS